MAGIHPFIYSLTHPSQRQHVINIFPLPLPAGLRKGALPRRDIVDGEEDIYRDRALRRCIHRAARYCRDRVSRLLL